MIPHDPLFTLRLVRGLLGFALVLSSLEYLALSRGLSPGGLWAAARPTEGGPGPWRAVIALRLLAGLGVALGSWPGWVLPSAALAFGTSLALALRLRWGLEGADQMQSVLSAGLALVAAVPDPAVVRAFLAFAATLSVAAYTTAGVMKAMMPCWQDGSLLAALLRTRQFGHPVFARLVAPGPRARAFSWMVIGFESLFPLALLGGAPGALAFCLAAFGFHLTTAVAMGLNVFPWAFAAALPAVVFWAEELRRMIVL